MQIKGKIFTVAGIILMFGYFITDSLKAPYDPTQVVMVGNDTLGRDWGAISEQIARDKMMSQSSEDGGLQTETDINGVGTVAKSSDKLGNIDSESEQDADPFSRQKFNQENYSTIISPDGREIITGYNRPEEQQAEEERENSNDGYRTRHQMEVGEPEMRYRD